MTKINKAELLKKLAIRRLDQIYCKIQKSNIHGVGLFAIRDIPIGTDPFNNSYMAHDAQLIHKADLLDQPDEIKKLLEDYWPSNKNIHVVVPLYPNQIILTNYLNYSIDNPNIKFNENGKWETLRNIKIGEELLENPHDLFDENGNYKIKSVSQTNYLEVKHLNT